MSQLPIFISGVDLGNLVMNSDLLQISCAAIKDLQAESSSDQQDSCRLSLRYKVDKKSKYTHIAFTTSTLSRKELLQQGGDLVSSTTLRELEFPFMEVQSPFLSPILRSYLVSKLEEVN